MINDRRCANDARGRKITRQTMARENKSRAIFRSHTTPASMYLLPFYFCPGHGSMGISNSIGSNTFDILLCLGLPWLIKSSFSPTQPGRHYISINSGGLEYSAISLLSTLMLLYIAFASNKFQLDRKVGRACLCMYAVFLILASLIELNVFFMVNLPTCQRTVK